MTRQILFPKTAISATSTGRLLGNATHVGMGIGISAMTPGAGDVG